MIRFPMLDPEEVQYWNATLAERLAHDLEDTGSDEKFLELFPWIFPRRLSTLFPKRAMRVYKELILRAEDRFEHDLSPVHQFVLYNTLTTWVEWTEESQAEALRPGKECDPAYARLLASEAEELKAFVKVAFPDRTFETVEDLALKALSGQASPHAVDWTQYDDLLPEDILRTLALLSADSK